MKNSDIKEKIKELFFKHPKEQYNCKQIWKRLEIPGKQSLREIELLLVSLAKENLLIEVYRGKYKLNPVELEKIKKLAPIVAGTVDMKQTGKAYVITTEYLEDIKISANNTYKALHGDTVKVRLFPKRKGAKLEGEIIEIIERHKTKFAGTIQLSRNFAFLIPDNKTTPVDFFVPLEYLNGALEGQKVIAEFTDWPDHAKNPFAKIIKVLGTPGNHDVEMNSILSEYDIVTTFEPEVTKAALNIPETIDSKEISKRVDFRNILTFTIDPNDAKDFDDAISFEKIDSSYYRIGVHIADVSHYVQENSIIDKEAYDRATSIYLVDRVIPMLPERLSNNICSLLPNEDKLTFSVVFDISDQAKITDIWYGKTIINSNRRFTYDEVQQIIEENKGEYNEEIFIVNDLAKKLRAKRMKNGSIDFNKKEVSFVLDDQGRPLDVISKEHKEAHKLIEEFMLLANRMVAEKIGKVKDPAKAKPFVYRVHDIPNPEKLNVLVQFVEKFGYKMKIDTRKNISNSFNKMLSDSSGKGEQNLIETLALRSMAKAEYSTQNIGHYGLAFDHYSHFTSPIRRYPDLVAHRLLFRYLNGQTPSQIETLDACCKHSSEMEKKAQLAERDSIKFKQVEFLSTKLGHIYDGLISGVSKWGIFVEITENKCEGLVRLRDISDDYYYHDEDNYQVIGHNSGRKYKLGDKIRVRIKRADILKKELDFELV